MQAGQSSTFLFVLGVFPKTKSLLLTHFSFRQHLPYWLLRSKCLCFVGWTIFRRDISGFSDPKFLVQPLAFCRKEPINFKPSCFHFHGNLLILVVGYTHHIFQEEADVRDGTHYCKFCVRYQDNSFSKARFPCCLKSFDSIAWFLIKGYKNIRNILSDLEASYQRDHLPLLLEGYSQFKQIFYSPLWESLAKEII